MPAHRIHQEVHSTGTNIQSRGAQAETQDAGAYPEVDDWKRLYLLGTMLVDLGFPDHDLLHNLGNGFKLSGWMPDSKLFPRRVPSLRFSVGHTDERTAELKQCLREIINNGELSTKEAERVMGRMISFDCYVFGRIANLDLKEFGNLCRLA
jgi:hypothetical protein